MKRKKRYSENFQDYLKGENENFEVFISVKIGQDVRQIYKDLRRSLLHMK